MSQIRSFTRSSRVGRPYAAGSRTNSRGSGARIVGAFVNRSGQALADQAAGVGVHERLKLLATQGRFEQLQQRALAGKIRCVGPKHQPLDRNRTAVTWILS